MIISIIRKLSMHKCPLFEISDFFWSSTRRSGVQPLTQDKLALMAYENMMIGLLYSWYYGNLSE